MAGAQERFRKVVENCHYFLNFHHLDQLETIVMKHTN